MEDSPTTSQKIPVLRRHARQRRGSADTSHFGESEIAAGLDLR